MCHDLGVLDMNFVDNIVPGMRVSQYCNESGNGNHDRTLAFPLNLRCMNKPGSHCSCCCFPKHCKRSRFFYQRFLCPCDVDLTVPGETHWLSRTEQLINANTLLAARGTRGGTESYHQACKGSEMSSHTTGPSFERLMRVQSEAIGTRNMAATSKNRERLAPKGLRSLLTRIQGNKNNSSSASFDRDMDGDNSCIMVDEFSPQSLPLQQPLSTMRPVVRRTITSDGHSSIVFPLGMNYLCHPVRQKCGDGCCERQCQRSAHRYQPYRVMRLKNPHLCQRFKAHTVRRVRFNPTIGERGKNRLLIACNGPSHEIIQGFQGDKIHFHSMIGRRRRCSRDTEFAASQEQEMAQNAESCPCHLHTNSRHEYSQHQHGVERLLMHGYANDHGPPICRDEFELVQSCQGQKVPQTKTSCLGRNVDRLENPGFLSTPVQEFKTGVARLVVPTKIPPIFRKNNVAKVNVAHQGGRSNSSSNYSNTVSSSSVQTVCGCMPQVEKLGEADPNLLGPQTNHSFSKDTNENHQCFAFSDPDIVLSKSKQRVMESLSPFKLSEQECSGSKAKSGCFSESAYSPKASSAMETLCDLTDLKKHVCITGSSKENSIPRNMERSMRMAFMATDTSDSQIKACNSTHHSLVYRENKNSGKRNDFRKVTHYEQSLDQKIPKFSFQEDEFVESPVTNFIGGQQDDMNSLSVSSCHHPFPASKDVTSNNNNSEPPRPVNNNNSEPPRPVNNNNSEPPRPVNNNSEPPRSEPPRPVNNNNSEPPRPVNNNSCSRPGPQHHGRPPLDGRVVRVEGDGRCLFRSLVTAEYPPLHITWRDEFGRPVNRELAEMETTRADQLRARVVSIMTDNMHFYSQLERGVINADQPMPSNYQRFKDRLLAMSNPSTMPGDLELNAVAMVMERQILVLDTNLSIITSYGHDRFPQELVFFKSAPDVVTISPFIHHPPTFYDHCVQSIPLAVRYTRLVADVGHYDAVILTNDCSGSPVDQSDWNSCSSSSRQQGSSKQDSSQHSGLCGDFQKLSTSGPGQNNDAPGSEANARPVKERAGGGDAKLNAKKEFFYLRDSDLMLHSEGLLPVSSKATKTSARQAQEQRTAEAATSTARATVYWPAARPGLVSKRKRRSFSHKQTQTDDVCYWMGRQKDRADESKKRYCFQHRHRVSKAKHVVSRRKRQPNERAIKDVQRFCRTACLTDDGGGQTVERYQNVNWNSRIRNQKIGKNCAGRICNSTPETLCASNLKRNQEPTYMVKANKENAENTVCSGVNVKFKKITPPFMSTNCKRLYSKRASCSGRARTRAALSRTNSVIKRKDPTTYISICSPSRKPRLTNPDAQMSGSCTSYGNARRGRGLPRRSRILKKRSRPQSPGSPRSPLLLPKKPRLPDAFEPVQCRCVLCNSKVEVAARDSVKCYLCGRRAHRVCVMKEFPGWGQDGGDQNYFLCSFCVAL
ncbi:LOW QUALITY PROTEIN: hypothetical protein PoB_001151700 [Plakobranchus ocellatus]|uniref:OTU domain-containing protein n=1 Tax=Plakobranchus ocellatus TaxID=259542 RepID=A0AAV3YSA3_9GAST|nr:LOW QUALITY PROTEIN: hypothetical protein PoB_001151700 [Plakobranchus ocellatus]